MEWGGGPVDCAGQGAILNHLVTVDSKSSKQGEVHLLYINTSRWSNLDKGFVKQGLWITLLTKHLKVENEKSPSQQNHHLNNHHDAVIEDGLQAEHSSLVDVNQVDLLARLAIPGQGLGLGWL